MVQKKGILNELFRALSRDVLSGLINIVAVQELLTMNQLERAEVEILRKFILQSIAEGCLFIMNYPVEIRMISSMQSHS